MQSAWLQFEMARPAWLAALLVVVLLAAAMRGSLTGYSRRRQALGLILRVLVLVALVLGLCRPQLRIQARSIPLAVKDNAIAPAVRVAERPKVMLVEGHPGAGRRLAEALRAGDLEVTSLGPGEIPASHKVLESYPCVVLVNVPAAAIREEQAVSLRHYVRVSGGGLVVVGGDRAFVPGGYRGTILDEILPVESVASRRGQRPSLAMVLVVDRSQSMEEGGAIGLAKEAMRRTIDLLTPEDQLGVLAFDEKSRWLSPIEPLVDKPRVLARVGSLTAGGRTDMAPALEKAGLALHEAFAARKHVIVLTDGISHPADFRAISRRIAGWGVTISTVALGREASRPLLAEIAEIGRGRAYVADDPRRMPEIFARETASASRLGIHEGPLKPRPGSGGALLSAPQIGDAPPLLGYLETRAKSGARVALFAAEGDPLLAAWRFGRGTSVAFTSDAEDHWAAAWLAWPGFGQFWLEIVRAALKSENPDTPVSQPASPPAIAITCKEVAATTTIALWHHFLAAAAVLFVVEIAMRRLL